MKPGFISVFLLYLLAFSAADSLAFRCGDGLVTSGDTRMQVMVTCGNPTSKEKVCTNSANVLESDRRGKTARSRKCPGKAEVWYYNCGDRDYIYELTFEDGVVVRESAIGRGKGPSDCRGK